MILVTKVLKMTTDSYSLKVVEVRSLQSVPAGHPPKALSGLNPPLPQKAFGGSRHFLAWGSLSFLLCL